MERRRAEAATAEAQRVTKLLSHTVREVECERAALQNERRSLWRRPQVMISSSALTEASDGVGSTWIDTGSTSPAVLKASVQRTHYPLTPRREKSQHLLPAAGKPTPPLIPWGPHGALTLYRDETSGQQRLTTLSADALLLPPAAHQNHRRVRSFFASLQQMNMCFAGVELSSSALLRESMLRPLPHALTHEGSSKRTAPTVRDGGSSPYEMSTSPTSLTYIAPYLYPPTHPPLATLPPLLFVSFSPIHFISFPRHLLPTSSPSFPPICLPPSHHSLR